MIDDFRITDVQLTRIGALGVPLKSFRWWLYDREVGPWHEAVQPSWRKIFKYIGLLFDWLADAWIAIGRWWQLDTEGPFTMFGMRGPSFNPPRWDHVPWQRFKKIISTCGKRYLATFDYITDERVEIGVGVSRNDLGAFSAHINFKGLDEVPEMTLDDIRLVEVKA